MIKLIGNSFSSFAKHFLLFFALPLLIISFLNVCFWFRLEKESGFFFNMKFFEEKVQAGEWEEVEKYLTGFTKVDDNRYSMKIFFEIRKQKYLEALDRYLLIGIA